MAKCYGALDMMIMMMAAMSMTAWILVEVPGFS